MTTMAIIALAKRREDLKDRQLQCWNMVVAFTANKDAHGVMDMGAEIQALERAIKEIESVSEGL